MKSPMVENASYIENKSGYSNLQVLLSGAGYYVGTIYTNVEEDGSTWTEPGSRDSDYFATRELAQAYLDTVEKADASVAALVLRQHPADLLEP